MTNTEKIRRAAMGLPPEDSGLAIDLLQLAAGYDQLETQPNDAWTQEIIKGIHGVVRERDFSLPNQGIFSHCR